MKLRRNRFNRSKLLFNRKNIFFIIFIFLFLIGYYQSIEEKVYSIIRIESTSIPDYIPNIPKYIIQTSKKAIDLNIKTNSFIRLNPTYKYFHYNDSAADEFVRQTMPYYIYQIYSSLPKSVLKADYFRYIVLLVQGGVYSDIDTTCLQPIDTWINEIYINKVGLIIGIEADTTLWEVFDGTYARRIQIVQWTIAAAPGHPILHQIVKKIADISPSMALKTVTQKQILEWTGPGVWTDVISDYLLGIYKFSFRNLKNLKEPKLIGDIYVLPITAFSPGLNRMGSKSINDSQAKVQHLFAGSWKNFESKNI
jgi:mannosyltransferase OCH1-like enzyme